VVAGKAQHYVCGSQAREEASGGPVARFVVPFGRRNHGSRLSYFGVGFDLPNAVKSQNRSQNVGGLRLVFTSDFRD
jgi:hypothetical protein